MDTGKIEAYDYPFNEKLIAQIPLNDRLAARMLVVSPQRKTISDHTFRDLISFLQDGDVVVFNNTRVRYARVVGRKQGSGGRVELLVISCMGKQLWQVMAKPAKRLKTGMVIELGRAMSSVIQSREGSTFTVRFCNNNKTLDNEAVENFLRTSGEIPLPPYIKSKLNDPERYQTVYNKSCGSTAAPTAGLHFTTSYLQQLRHKGVIMTEVELQIGPATFQPVKTSRIAAHKMHREYYALSEETAATLNAARKEKRRIIAVGTTSLRTIESNLRKYGEFRCESSATELFIYPGQKINSADALLTNFHLPRSTLLMLVAAFGGYKLIMRAYQHAVERQYRFYSLGDAMFISENIFAV